MRFGIRHLGILLGAVVLAGVGRFLMQGSGRSPIHTDAGETTHVGVEGTPSEYSKAISSAGDFSPGVEPVVRREQPSTLEQPPTPQRQDVFADCTRHAGATLTILSSIDGGRWETDAYKWKGFARIDYHRKELTQFRGKWRISPLPAAATSSSRYYRSDMGSFWFQAEIAADGKIYRSPGIEDSYDRGISPKVFRMSVRDGQGYIGYLTSFFNVPGLFGSINYQSSNYIGVDCADVLMAALAAWNKKPMQKNYNVAMLVTGLTKVAEFDLSYGNTAKKPRWGSDVRPGDFIAVRYPSHRQYAHIGALYSDANKNGLLDAADTIIHAGPALLHFSHLKEGNFDGHVVILRP